MVTESRDDMRLTTPLTLMLMAPAALSAQEAAVDAQTRADAAVATPAASTALDADAEAEARMDAAMARARAEGLTPAMTEGPARWSRPPFSCRLCRQRATMRQILPAASSDTYRAPSGPSASPVGRYSASLEARTVSSPAKPSAKTS